MRSAVILAGGRSKRMNGDKGEKLLAGVPLIDHTISRLAPHVDQVIIVASTPEKARSLQRSHPRTSVVHDARGAGTPMDGAATGLHAAGEGYAFLTGHDMPFLNAAVVRLLFEAAEGRDAATPLWPNGFVEPLHAVYHAERAASAADALLAADKHRLSLILRSLRDVAHVPVDEIRRVDPGLLTFRDADTPEALAEAERILRDFNPSS